MIQTTATQLRNSAIFVFALIVLVASCKKDDASPDGTAALEALPKDTGGTHKANPLGSNASPYGYYLYTPSGYTNSGPKFPLLVFMHGSGEIGNSSTNSKNLDKILANGPPKLIKAGKWVPKFPMVVASLQIHDGWYDLAKVKKFTEFIIANYQVDTTRIYLTGLSMGGYGVWDQVMTYGKGSHATAIVPISGSGILTGDRTKKAAPIPVWAFHGAEDQTVAPAFDKAVHKAINDLNPEVRAKLTIYPATDHDAWTKTYNSAGMTAAVDPAYDPFSMDIYSWMLQYVKQPKK